MIIKETRCKSILNKSKLSADYCLNPYTGCSHKCAYCYARFMKKYTNHDEEWGDFVDIKINAPEIIRKDLKNSRGRSVFISSVTDAYQPIEGKYRITRKLLENLPKDFSVYIQTKSSLVTRDIDILKRFKNASVGFTITFSDDRDRKNLEPFADKIQNRLDALKKIKDSGIGTTVFIGPVLPFISDKKLEQLFEKISFADEIMVDRLNIKSGNWFYVNKVIKQEYPELIEKYNSIFFGKDDYYQKLKQRVKQINKKARFCYRCKGQGWQIFPCTGGGRQDGFSAG